MRLPAGLPAGLPARLPVGTCEHRSCGALAGREGAGALVQADLLPLAISLVRRVRKSDGQQGATDVREEAGMD